MVEEDIGLALEGLVFWAAAAAAAIVARFWSCRALIPGTSSTAHFSITLANTGTKSFYFKILFRGCISQKQSC